MDTPVDPYEIPIETIHQCSPNCATKYEEIITKKSIGHMVEFRAGQNSTYVDGKCSKYHKVVKNSYVAIANFDKNNHDLYKPNETVIFNTKYTMEISYPLTHPATFTFNSARGFSRLDVINNIVESYHAVYKKEEASMNTVIEPINKRTGLVNRQSSNGAYGIWGHDIDDLVIEGMQYDPNTHVLTMFIGS